MRQDEAFAPASQIDHLRGFENRVGDPIEELQWHRPTLEREPFWPAHRTGQVATLGELHQHILRQAGQPVGTASIFDQISSTVDRARAWRRSRPKGVPVTPATPTRRI